MRKLRKAAVVVTVLGSVGLLGAGTAYAGGGTSDYSRTQTVREGSYQPQSSGGHRHGKSHARKTYIRQTTSCRTFEKNSDVLGEIGADDPLWILTHGLRSRPEVQKTRIGSSEGCNNIIRL
ncbi:hypothetical protein [Streptomyces natalensis]|uniref:Uncharacterized protein n=1 Tax=Streptomyces natalensis ATCC 27448 TaxID=1240678 RepID=A0A0D7CJP8_9ACTN|nr:hypothetical protein [Streptomyces natalensis]KIZ16266.1 hypothetical protein SNA_24070 [Streptomyces natalensis ATCC 27448]